MRKYSVILLLLSFTSAFAQTSPVLKNRRGIAILPQQNDYCIGFSANPFLTYFGNMFNGSSNNFSPVPSFSSPNKMIFAKYMKTNSLAYRANFRIGYTRDVITFNVKDMSPGAATNAVVSDVQKRNNTFIGLGLGIEKRKGVTRLQGYYGADAMISFSSGDNINFEYGNKLEYLDTGIIRVKKLKASSLFSIGFRGFAGVEYFIAPKFSIGAELGYGPSIGFRSTAEQSTEQQDFQNNAVMTETNTLSPKSSNISVDTDNYNGLIKMLFYF